FLKHCLDYVRLRDDNAKRQVPLPFDTDGDYDLREEDKPPILPCERYAVLAALRDSVCHQEQPLDPAPWREGSILQNNIVWECLVASTKRLDGSQRRNVQACIDFVRTKLGNCRSEDEWARAVEEVLFMPAAELSLTKGFEGRRHDDLLSLLRNKL